MSDFYFQYIDAKEQVESLRTKLEAARKEIEELRAKVCTYPESKLCICPHFRGHP